MISKIYHRSALTDAIRSQARTAPASVIARRLGTTRQYVSYVRWVDGIPPFHLPLETRKSLRAIRSLGWLKKKTGERFDEIKNRLGKEPDEIIAQELNIPVPTIGYHRKNIGIASLKSSRAGKPIIWLQKEHPHFHEIMERLGKIPDPLLAREYGITANQVAYRRRKHGIPASPHTYSQSL